MGKRIEGLSPVRKLLMTATFMSFACLYVHADGVSKEVTLTEAGTLPTLITDTEKNTITSLKVSGPINGVDTRFLHEMAGTDFIAQPTDGQLAELDLSEANIVGGGNYYVYVTHENVIGENAFMLCYTLQSIKLPSSVTNIEAGAFFNCNNLSTVIIGDSVTSIGDYAFSFCSNLPSVIIPASVTSIGAEAFASCSNLKEMTLQGSKLPTCGRDVFSKTNTSDMTLYCKSALVETCKNTAPWSGFKNIKATDFHATISDAGIATACSDNDLDFTDVEGVKAYIASGFSSNIGKVLLTRVMQIPAGTGFILKGTEGTYDIPVSVTDYTYANLLVGTLESTNMSETTGSYTKYVLGNGDNGVGFYLPSADFVVSAGKAYLQIPTSTAAAKRSIGISFEDEDGTATGFISVKELNEAVSGNSAVYNITGQRKQGLSQGLNIVDGKKIFIR